ncbi:MAG: hypothetical protein HS119_02790 [Flavobacteriales bacterium]|nr:hypothetical protein [Flavobacteriales bacterium]
MKKTLLYLTLLLFTIGLKATTEASAPSPSESRYLSGGVRLITLPNGATSATFIPNGSVAEVQGLFTINSSAVR